MWWIPASNDRSITARVVAVVAGSISSSGLSFQPSW